MHTAKSHCFTLHIFFPAAGKRISCHLLNHQSFLPDCFKHSFIIPYVNFCGHCPFLVRECQSLKFHVLGSFGWFLFSSSTLVLFHFFPGRGSSDISKQHICCMVTQKKLRSCLCTFPQKTPPELAAPQKRKSDFTAAQRHKLLQSKAVQNKTYH